MNIQQLQEQLRAFARARDWERFHSPKNLSMALSVEIAELVEVFQWRTEEQSLALDTESRESVAEEIADVQIYLAMLADRLDIDIAAAVDAKIGKNARKYPEPNGQRS